MQIVCLILFHYDQSILSHRGQKRHNPINAKSVEENGDRNPGLFRGQFCSQANLILPICPNIFPSEHNSLSRVVGFVGRFLGSSRSRARSRTPCMMWLGVLPPTRASRLSSQLPLSHSLSCDFTVAPREGRIRMRDMRLALRGRTSKNSWWCSTSWAFSSLPSFYPSFPENWWRVFCGDTCHTQD